MTFKLEEYKRVISVHVYILQDVESAFIKNVEGEEEHWQARAEALH